MVHRFLAIAAWLLTGVLALWILVMGLLVGVYAWVYHQPCTEQSCEGDFFGALLLIIVWLYVGYVAVPIGALGPTYLVGRRIVRWRRLRVDAEHA